MKSLILITCIAFLATMHYACNNSNAAKNTLPTTSEEASLSTSEKLKNIGFLRSSTVLNAAANEEKHKYESIGLVYISKVDADAMMEENNFIIGPSISYIGNIPEDAANKLLQVYNLIREKFEPIYIDPIGRYWPASKIEGGNQRDIDWIKSTGRALLRDVLVIAPSSKFDHSGMVLTGRQLTEPPKNPDPIAVVETEFGYVELANW